MTPINRRAFTRTLSALAAIPLLGRGIGQARAEVKGLELLAPSSPGSGYDQLARAMQAVLLEEKLASGIQVQNVPGGGGTVGLAQFITSRKRGPALIVVGFALVGGVLTTKSPVTLDALVPIGRLMGETNILVVPAGSDIAAMADLVAGLKANPARVTWAGGSIGGIDHVTTGPIAKTVGVDPKKVNYVVHAGGGEVMASVLGGHATVGVSGVDEFRGQIQAGKLRALAVSGDQRVPGLDVPTLKEAGVALAVTNWRGVLAHPSTGDADKKDLADMIAAMVKSAAWKTALEKRGWTDNHLPPQEFGAFLKDEKARIEGALKDVGLV